MFSFHKPKIYRSISGCCICKAKSSSSRFTDSKKYEAEFEKCFCITEKRSGEICNACVLLVKRWKKLPPGTQRDWRHVVDARAGPGTKSLKNAKLNCTATGSSVSNSQKKVQKPKRVKSSTSDLNENGEADSNGDSLNQMSNLGIESDSSEDIEDEEDDYLSDYDETDTKRKLRTRNNSNINKSSMNTSKHSSKRNNNNVQCDGASQISSFLDMSFWRKEKICCGIIFKGPDNEVLLHPKLLKPCSCRINAMQSKLNTGSDSSSIASTSPLEDDANSNASSSNNFNI